MKRFQGPYERGTDNGNGYSAVARTINGRFIVVQWNAHHKNWTRQNRNEGGAFHRNLETLVNDNIGGGPVCMALAAARELAGVG